MLDKLKKYESFSFAFDGVLIDDFDGSCNPYKEEMQTLCKELISKGKKVFLYTKRYPSNGGSVPKKGTKRNNIEYEVVENFAKELNIIGNVLYSSRNTFYQNISEYSDSKHRHCHFDNSDYEIILFRTFRPEVKSINIKDENWRETL